MLSNLYASNAYVTSVRSVSPLSHECWSCNTPRARPQFPGAGDFQGGLYEKDRFSWTPLSFVRSSDGSVAPLLCRLKVGGNRPVTTGGRVRLSVADCQLPSATFLFCRGYFGSAITQYFSGSAHHEAAVGSFWMLDGTFWVSGPKRFKRNFSYLHF